jgi:hypothetical protein
MWEGERFEAPDSRMRCFGHELNIATGKGSIGWTESNGRIVRGIGLAVGR